MTKKLMITKIAKILPLITSKPEMVNFSFKNIDSRLSLAEIVL
jgi:hypothetical protein